MTLGHTQEESDGQCQDLTDKFKKDCLDQGLQKIMGKECTKFYSEMKETTPGCFNKEGGVFQLVECEFEQKPGCE